MNSIRKK